MDVPQPAALLVFLLQPATDFSDILARYVDAANYMVIQLNVAGKRGTGWSRWSTAHPTSCRAVPLTLSSAAPYVVTVDDEQGNWMDITVINALDDSQAVNFRVTTSRFGDARSSGFRASDETAMAVGFHAVFTRRGLPEGAQFHVDFGRADTLNTERDGSGSVPGIGDRVGLARKPRNVGRTVH